MSLYLRLDPFGALAPETDLWRMADQPGRNVILPLAPWMSVPDRSGLGVLLQPTDDPYALEGVVNAAALVAVEFPKFTDGRGLSIAALLRKRLGYRGELRAVGDVLADHLFAMARCGFNAFSLRADQRLDEALKAFTLFPDVYQDAADEIAPLFRRRESGLAGSPFRQRAAG
jgi:uncharacterized protein (DUF934 family)